MNALSDQSRFSHYRRIELEGKIVCVPKPAEIPQFRIVERDDLLNRCLAAWLTIDGLPPLNFRLYGPPGSGKNALVYQLARYLGRDLYILNGHKELGPENVACYPVVTASQSIEYVASPIIGAMYYGGIAFFDEIGKAPSSALDPLASLLDDRRTLNSVLAGIHFKAHPDFLFCAALNQNEEVGLGLPDFIEERTSPAILVDYPSDRILKDILKTHLPTTADSWFEIFLKDFKGELSPRAAISVLGYAFRLSMLENRLQPSMREIKNYIERARQKRCPEKKSRRAG